MDAGEKKDSFMYFVALLCPADIQDRVQQHKLWMKEQFGSVVALKAPAHITLVRPFWLEGSWEEYLRNTLLAFKWTGKKPLVRLQAFSHFSNRVIYIAVWPDPALQELKKNVEAHFIHSFGDSLRKDSLPFHPHVTIANRDLKPGDFKKAWDHFSKKEFNAEFDAGTITLLKLVDSKWETVESVML